MDIDPSTDLYYAKFLGNYNNDFYLKYVPCFLGSIESDKP